MALLIFVLRLFATSRGLAVEAAPVLFMAFARYQILLGIIACAAGTVLSVLTRRVAVGMLTLLMLIAFSSAILIRTWTIRMNILRVDGRSNEPLFKHLHALSSSGYLVICVALLVVMAGYFALFHKLDTLRPPHVSGGRK